MILLIQIDRLQNLIGNCIFNTNWPLLFYTWRMRTTGLGLAVTSNKPQTSLGLTFGHLGNIPGKTQLSPTRVLSVFRGKRRKKESELSYKDRSFWLPVTSSFCVESVLLSFIRQPLALLAGLRTITSDQTIIRLLLDNLIITLLLRQGCIIH